MFREDAKDRSTQRVRARGEGRRSSLRRERQGKSVFWCDQDDEQRWSLCGSGAPVPEGGVVKVSPECDEH